MNIDTYDFLSYSPKSIESFKLFSIAHITAIIIIILFCIISCSILQKQKYSKYRKPYRYILLFFIVVAESLYKLWKIVIANKSLSENLSLNLCGVTIILCAIILINKDEKLYEIAYFWGLAGATQAIITPDIGRYGFPHYCFFHIFISHGLILAVVTYMTIVEELRPKKGGLKRIFIITNIFTAFVALVNYTLDTNYLFICHKPNVPSLLDYLGPWPWYIIPLELIALIMFTIVYIPIVIVHYKNDSRNNLFDKQSIS